MVDNKRSNTMRERLGSAASSLCNNNQYLPRARAVQNMTTPEEFEAIVKLAQDKDNPPHYFMKMISKERIESTLKHVRRLLNRSVEAMSYVARKVGNTSKSFMNYIGDKMAEGKYPMNQVVNMVELASRKRQPDRYLIGILKKGYQHAEYKVCS